jgi:AcrR family transcriptional regulator
MSAPRTARERVREEMTAEILTAARERVADEGAAALSLRSVARDLEMAPSALYRYFDGRDALLSALILGAYESLAAEAEQAAEEVAVQAAVHAATEATAPATPPSEAGSSDAERFLAVPRAIRGWALAHPHEWGLIFGTPVPGYDAPEDTVEPYARIAAAMMRPVVEARAAGRLATAPYARAVSDELRQAVAPVTKGLFPDMPTVSVVLAIQAWTTLVGVISLEVFGHWRNTILEPEEFFEATIRDMAAMVGLS